MEHPIDAIQGWYLRLGPEQRTEIAGKALGETGEADRLEERFNAWLDEGREQPHRVLLKVRQFLACVHAELGHKKDLDGWARGLTAMAILSARLRGNPTMAVLHRALSSQVRTAGARQQAWDDAFQELRVLTGEGGPLSNPALIEWCEQEAGPNS